MLQSASYSIGQLNRFAEGNPESRVPYEFRDRTLPHFGRDDLGLKSKGFVENSFFKGVAPHEFFFLAKAGRYQMIETRLNQERMSRMRRDLIKAMEDLIVHYDMTVRNSCGQIVQFVYGEDGLDGRYMSEGISKYRLTDRAGNQKMVTDETSFILESDQEYAFLLKIMEPSMPYEIRLPVPWIQILHRAAAHISWKTASAETPLDPIRMARAANKLIARLKVVKGTDPISQEMQYNATLYTRLGLLCILHPSSQCMQRGENRLNAESFVWALREIERSFERRIITPGESVGVVAAQAYGIPKYRKLVLRAGVVQIRPDPQLNDMLLLMRGEEPKPAPFFRIMLKSIENDNEYSRIMRNLEELYLRDVIVSMEILRDPDSDKSAIEEDREWLAMWLEFSFMEDEEPAQSPWVIRIVLDRDKVIHRHLMMSELADSIENKVPFKHRVCCKYSDDNADTLVLRVRVALPPSDVSEEGEAASKKTTEELLDTLMHSKLRGIAGFKGIYYTPIRGNGMSGFMGYGSPEGLDFGSLREAPAIDFKQSSTTSIQQTAKYLGIEAARAMLFKEFSYMLMDGGCTNVRHAGLFADMVTHTGVLRDLQHVRAPVGSVATTTTTTPTLRSGVSGVGGCCADSPLREASERDPVEALWRAAVFGGTGDCDRLRGVSERIITGQMPPSLGTSFEGFQLLNKKI